MPLSTFETHFGLPNGYNTIELRPKSRELLEAAKAEVTQIMRRSHNLADGAENDFNIVSPDDVTAGRRADRRHPDRPARGHRGGVAAGRRHRHHEHPARVGRRAHARDRHPRRDRRGARADHAAVPGRGRGARRRSARSRAWRSGVGIGLVVAKQMDWPRRGRRRTWWSFSALFGIVVGTVFGYMPAKRAAQLDPIEALRRE